MWRPPTQARRDESRMNRPAEAEVATVLKMLKQRVSWKMRRKRKRKPLGQLRLEFAEEAKLKSFWQARYYDFNVHSEEKRIEKIRCIHRNPVTRGLVTHPEEYRWSSFNHYATGEVGTVEIESEWTARRRERAAD